MTVNRGTPPRRGKRMRDSTTLWFNWLSAAVLVATALQGSELVAAYPRAAAGLGTFLCVANALLRLKTNEPIAGIGRPR